MKFEQAIGLFTAGQLPEAERLCREVLALEPQHAHALHMLALIRADAGELEQALELLRQALATGVQHPAIYCTHGKLLMRLDRHEEAAEPLGRSLHMDPHQPQALRMLAVAFTQSGRYSEAKALLGPALVALPDDAALLDALAMTHMAQGRYAEAAVLLERVVASAPDFPGAYGNLAIVYEQSNRLQDAERLLAEGLKHWPAHATLRLTRARLLRRAGEDAAARAEFLDMQCSGRLKPAVTRDIEYELGWCADGLDETQAAFKHFELANTKAEALSAPTAEFRASNLKTLAAMMELYGGMPPPSTGPASDANLPIFLFGFPRSGNTLLDTMLGAHGDFEVLEERPTLQAMMDAYLATGLRYPEDIPALTAQMRLHLKDVHTRACHKEGWDGSRRLVDKMPFATVHAGLIQEVFPGAPMVFMTRHPCDVVLSCFMHNFEINSGTVHFTRLQSTVRLYCDVMALWQLYIERPGWHHIMLRYEDLVTEPERQMRRLLDFLEVPWADAVLDHSSHALKRGRIPTPSYSQVSRPLYQDARDRWRRYATYLQPHMQELMPYIEAFGYAA